MLDKKVVTKGRYGDVVRTVEHIEPWVNRQMLWSLVFKLLIVSHLTFGAMCVLFWELIKRH